MNSFTLPSDIRLRQLNGRPQLIIDSPENLRQVLSLSPVHWSANSAPINGLSSNRLFLEYLDSDQNNRIMPSEIHQAILWIISRVTDLQGCVAGQDFIDLTNFREDTQDGVQLKETAQVILNNLQKGKLGVIHLKDVQKRAAIMQVGTTNGDGILPPSILSGIERQFVEDCLKVFDGSLDIHQNPGIDEHLLTTFNEKLKAWNTWQQRNPHPSFTEDMSSVVETLQPAIESHFIWNKYPVEMSNPTKQLTNSPTESLTQTQWIHPQYRIDWKSLWDITLGPLSVNELTYTTWESIWWMNKEHRDWIENRPKGRFNSVSIERLQEMSTEHHVQESLRKKLEQDQAVSIYLKQLSDLEKTLLFQQNLCTFLNSFINFSNFYNPRTRSVPEVGSLLLDGRWFRLVVYVPNRDEHIKQAQNSGFFLLYLTVTQSNRNMEIAAAVTGAERGDLHLGKKAVFYDVEGTQFPAEITYILDNPININEALLKPIEKLQQLGKKRFEKFSKEQEAQLETSLDQESSIKSTQWMNGGVTLAALSSSFAYLLKTITSVKVSSIVLVILAPLFLLALFSSLIAGWKLHRRDLGPILEASGWGINHPLRVPEWASEVFTLDAYVPAQNQSQDKDLLMVFEHTADPRSWFTRMFMWLCILTLVLMTWWQWEHLIIFLQNWEASTLPQ